MTTSEDIKKEIGVLVRRRAVFKSSITRIVNKLNSLETQNILNNSIFSVNKTLLLHNLDKINAIDSSIIDLMILNKIDIDDKDYYTGEMDGQVDYSMDFALNLVKFDKYKDKEVTQVDSNINTTNNLDDVYKKTIDDLKLPSLCCDNFDGTEQDKLKFPTFLNKFNNVIGNRSNLTNSIKMTFLKSFLRDYALKVIDHLSINDTNYDVALTLLKKEFLDRPFIINEHLNKILTLNIREGFDDKFMNTKMYLNEIRAIIYDLKDYELDFLENQTAGNALLSHIVFKGLPRVFKNELIHVVKSTYPTLNQILDNYSDVINTLCAVSSSKPRFTSPSVKPKFKINNNNNNNNNNNAVKFNNSSLQNFQTSLDDVDKHKNNNNELDNYKKPNVCKLCQLKLHPLYKCDVYTTSALRIAQAKELNLCTRCCGVGHNQNTCFGKTNKLKYSCFRCKNNFSHITALCPSERTDAGGNETINSMFISSSLQSDKIYLLPTITFELCRGNRRVRIRGLLDSGSQRSYLSKEVLSELSVEYDKLYNKSFNIKTFIGLQQRNFKQLLLGFKFENEYIGAPFLVDEDLSLKYEVNGVNEAIQNIKQQNIKLSDSAFYSEGDHGIFQLQALIGVDIIQHLPSFELVSKMKGSCFRVNNKYIPFGNVQNFMTRDQIRNLNALDIAPPPIEGAESETLCDTVVNLILNPVKSYFHPLESMLTDSQIDNGLERMFSLESMGIPSNTDEGISSYDNMMVNKFKDNIVFKDNFYHIKLPWHEDKIKQVPSNFNVALSVLNRVHGNLEKKGLINDYQKVFDQQLKDGIIERINVPNFKKYDYVYIPHRPVIKTDEQISTKIRVVYNCSFKSNKNTPSLNEASYSGIDLMNSLLKLLLVFRTNNYVVLSDVKQAFLSIYLREEADRNKFCFLWRQNNEIITYRFNTILFGYTASPFILHYIMKHHVNKYPKDKCTEILSSNFFVDNLIFTGNDFNYIKDLYNLTFNRMKEGGFTLRSWNTNNTDLKDIFKRDGVYVEHQSEYEKVLGYRFGINDQCMYVAQVDFKNITNTKRMILSETSKIWDPLGFCLPITIRGKLLIKGLWELKYDWDTILPDDITKEWVKLKNDLTSLPEVAFSRQALNDNLTYGLNIFCDSSSSCYGFIAYGSSIESNEFLFAKSKVAPSSSKKAYSIPTLELLGVILALKCLNSILDAYNQFTFEYINISVDSQVVLNWLLTGETKVKAKYVNNRIKDAMDMINNIKEQYKIKFMFHYVHTEQNPADLLTRGINIKKFKENIEFWLNGPIWLTKYHERWPKFPLLSIPPELNNYTTIYKFDVNINMPSEILDINKYSSFDKVLNITKYLFKILCNVNKKDPYNLALLYWVKRVQNIYFSDEVNFLNNKDNKKERVPVLVDNLNLFIDKNNVIRSKGRISKCTYFSYDVHNPIVLSRFHHFTELLIVKSHKKVLHLGVDSTLTYLRNQGYWIPKGRMAVKRVISNCVTCRKINARAYKYPKYTDLPKHHMTLVKPFKFVGIDYTGHLYIKRDNSVEQDKMFILIFTCLNIRAIHIELLPDMSVTNFLLAFQRFCNLYTIPDYVYSDNARTFDKGGSILSRALTSDEFKEELEHNNIKHVKIPLYSAWWGAFWERQIRTMKSCMYKVIGRSKLTYFELLTTLSFIKNAINSRPITYRSESSSIETITPNSFLKLNCNSSLLLREDDYDVWKEPGQKSLDKTLDAQEQRYELFRQLWYEEYILSLRETYRGLYEVSWENSIKVGDIVLIKSIIKSRPFWMTGRVIEVVMGQDNKIRAVQLKQSNSQTAYHSISNLYPLELSITNQKAYTGPIDDNNNTNDNTNDNNNNNIVNRPKRQAAIKCSELIRSQLD